MGLMFSDLPDHPNDISLKTDRRLSRLFWRLCNILDTEQAFARYVRYWGHKNSGLYRIASQFYDPCYLTGNWITNAMTVSGADARVVNSVLMRDNRGGINPLYGRNSRLVTRQMHHTLMLDLAKLSDGEIIRELTRRVLGSTP